MKGGSRANRNRVAILPPVTSAIRTLREGSAVGDSRYTGVGSRSLEGMLAELLLRAARDPRLGDGASEP